MLMTGYFQDVSVRPHMAEVVSRMAGLQAYFPGGDEPIQMLDSGKDSVAGERLRAGA